MDIPSQLQPITAGHRQAPVPQPPLRTGIEQQGEHQASHHGMGVTAMLQQVAQFRLRVVGDAAVAIEQVQVRQIAANGGERDEQPAPDVGGQSRLAGARRARDGFTGNEPDQGMGEIIHELPSGTLKTHCR